MLTTRHMSREIGTALAVLAIYLLTVLMPLHQARASQLAFEQAGYASTRAGWVLCSAAGLVGSDSDAAVAKCPATGVGKIELLQPALLTYRFDHTGMLLDAPLPEAGTAYIPRIATPPSGSRAPPVAV